MLIFFWWHNANYFNCLSLSYIVAMFDLVRCSGDLFSGVLFG